MLFDRRRLDAWPPQPILATEGPAAGHLAAALAAPAGLGRWRWWPRLWCCWPGGCSRVRYDHNLLHLQAQNLDSVKWEMTLIEHTAGASWHALSYHATRRKRRWP